MTPQSRGRPLVALLLCGLLLGGCGTVQKETRDLSLQAATSAYLSALRWGYFETAWGYVDPKLRRDKGLPAGYQDVRLTGYEIVQPPIPSSTIEVTQIVAYDYFHEDRQVVKQVVDRQVWRYDPKIKNWWLVSGLPKFE